MAQASVSASALMPELESARALKRGSALQSVVVSELESARASGMHTLAGEPCSVR